MQILQLGIGSLNFTVQFAHLGSNIYRTGFIFCHSHRFAITGRVFPGATNRTWRTIFQVLLDNICKHQHIVTEQFLQFIIQRMAVTLRPFQLHLEISNHLRRCVFRLLRRRILLSSGLQFLHLQFAFRQDILERFVFHRIGNFLLEILLTSLESLHFQKGLRLFILQELQLTRRLIAAFPCHFQVFRRTRNFHIERTDLVPEGAM